jgi:hypothetical protein
MPGPEHGVDQPGETERSVAGELRDRPEVRQPLDLCPVKGFTQAGRGIVGEVMIGELAEIRVGGRYVPVLLGIGSSFAPGQL